MKNRKIIETKHIRKGEEASEGQNRGTNEICQMLEPQKVIQTEEMKHDMNILD